MLIVHRESHMTTDTTEKGLEDLIVTATTGVPSGRSVRPGPKVSYPTALYGGTGWILGDWRDYDREHCLDLTQLRAFLDMTQPRVAVALALTEDGPTRRRFLARLQGEINKRGTIDLLRHGVKDGPHQIDLFDGTPSPGNPAASERYAANRFSVTRQLRYSRDETQIALDLALLINGLPVATFELKNNLTRQTVEDAVLRYQRDRNPREKLFEFGRCAAHFAVDDHEVRFCTHLKGKGSWFLPFNQGWNDGAGNPPNPRGLKTDYLWKRLLTPRALTDILESYAQIVETKDEKTGRKKRLQIWPRFHQRDLVRRLLADVRDQGAGRRYLMQHSAGSGKSNSIARLAHQLIGIQTDDTPVLDSIVVVTDRRILDKQSRDTIKQFAQVGATVGHAEHSGDLRRYVESHDHAIRLQAEIMVDHFHEQVLALNKIGGQARAMVVTTGIASSRPSSITTRYATTWSSARVPIGPSSPSRASTTIPLGAGLDARRAPGRGVPWMARINTAEPERPRPPSTDSHPARSPTRPGVRRDEIRLGKEGRNSRNLCILCPIYGDGL